MIAPLYIIVDIWINVPRDLQARFFQIGDMLMEHGPQQVGMPHVRHLEGDLWEMRMKGKSGIARAIYFTVVGKRIIVETAWKDLNHEYTNWNFQRYEIGVLGGSKK